jgi:hypothetical protein
MATTLDAYYPYDAGPGANITESQWRTFMARLHPSAVLAGVSNEFRPFGDSSGLQVKVDTGAAWVRGAYGESTAQKTLGIAAVGGIPGGQSRIDSIILRNDFVNNRVELDVLTGTAGASPSAPALTQSSSVWEILLGNVGSLTNATSTITAAMVSDGRWKMTESGILYHEQTPSGVSAITLPGAGTFPSGYRDLEITIDARSDQAATSTAIGFAFNGDTGSNYEVNRLSGGNSAASSAGIADTNPATFGLVVVPGASATSGFPGTWTVRVPSFARTSFHKAARAEGQYFTSAAVSAFTTELRQQTWKSTAALTTLLLTLAGGNFASGSVIRAEVRP